MEAFINKYFHSIPGLVPAAALTMLVKRSIDRPRGNSRQNKKR